MPGSATSRLVVLVSGTGTLLQALIEATSNPAYGAQIVGVGADRDRITALHRADRAGLPTFVHPLLPGADRTEWDRKLTAQVAAFAPDLVVSAGFLKLVGPDFLAEFGGRMINTHPSLLPAFPGLHGPRDALAYGVKVSGATIFLVDAGVDSGVILAQAPVPVLDNDSAETLHDRIKVNERDLLVATTHKLVTCSWSVTDRKVHWD